MTQEPWSRRKGAAALWLLNVSAGGGDVPIVVKQRGVSNVTDEKLHIEENVMIPMRDGIALATDIYHPLVDGRRHENPLPVILHRTPYDKSDDRFTGTARYFAEAGYIVAVQDVRGRYRSEGTFSKYRTEGVDGYDTIQWLADQPYALSRVGMWGTSYGAHVQADAAKLSPEALKVIILNMGGMSDGWNHKIRNHGAFELQQQMEWAFRQAAAETDDPTVRAALDRQPVEHWITAYPLRKGQNPLSVAPDYEDYLLEMAQNGDYEHWTTIGTNWIEYYDQTIDIPMLHISGWYDSYAGGTVDNYVALSSKKQGPIRLIMGPWVHGGQGSSIAGEVEFGPDATLDGFEREFHLRYYDAYLKERPGDIEDEAPVSIFVMGTGDGSKDENGHLFHGGYWRKEQSWPLPETAFQPYYFHADGTLSPERPSAPNSSTTYTFDPAHPVPTIGGSFTGPRVPGLAPAGAWHQQEREGQIGSQAPYLPLKSRSDVLVFQTVPLEEDVEIIGPIEVTLHVSSTAVDTDFTAKLIDVYPPSSSYPCGFEMNLTDGIIRARYRNSPNSQELMTPGLRYEIVFRLFPTANRFKKGHRIRVDISSSNFPRFDVNPNTGEPLGQERRSVIADNTIYHSAERPSCVILPIVPISNS